MSDWYSQLPSFGWPDFDGQATPSRYATVRYNNPGGMYPGSAARAFGSTGTGVIGGGHLIANFPTPVHGAAANMQNIVSGGYVGMPIGAAISKWSGGGRGTVPGFDSSQRITPEMTRDPNFMVPFMKAVASGEAPGRYPMTDDQWNQAYTWYAQGKSEGPAAPGVATASGGDYPDRTPQERKMPTTSLMDLMQGNAQPQDAMGQPTNWGNALAARSNSLIGLGLGLLQPYRPWAGESPYTNALRGYMAGAQGDESSAQNAWKRQMAERQFGLEQQKFNITDAQKAMRDVLGPNPSPEDKTKFMREFYFSKLEGDWKPGVIKDPNTETEHPYSWNQRTNEYRWGPNGPPPSLAATAGGAAAPDVFTRGTGGVGYGTGGMGPGGFGTNFADATTPPTTITPAPAAPTAAASSTGAPQLPAWMATQPPSVRKEAMKEAAKEQIKMQTTQQAQEPAAKQSAQNVIRAIDKIDDLVSKNPRMTTGLGGQMLSNVGGTPANDVAANLDTVAAAASLDKLQAMRAASPSGASGLGAVTEGEHKLLQASIAALRQSQSYEQFRENLAHVRATYGWILNRTNPNEPPPAPPQSQYIGRTGGAALPARTPSAGAVQALQADPSKRDEFDRWYGAGASNRYLGR